MRHAFITQLRKNGINLTEMEIQKYYNDTKLYCEEMEFTTENKIIAGIEEYIACQIHYGIFQQSREGCK